MPDIEFNCPHCQQSLAVEETGAGMAVQCPGCGKDITVPKLPQPATPPKLTLKQPEPPVLSGQTKKCPFCAEGILASAKKCKHCGSMLEEPQEHVVSAPVQPQTKKCPFCAEEILASAAKCKHCGSMMDGSGQPSSQALPVNMAEMKSQTKFALLDGETMISESLATYNKKLSVGQCNIYLTSHRFVACELLKKGTFALLGPAAGIAALAGVKATAIQFQIFHGDLASVTEKKFLGKIIGAHLKTKTGEDYNLTGLTPEWIDAIRKAFQT